MTRPKNQSAFQNAVFMDSPCESCSLPASFSNFTLPGCCRLYTPGPWEGAILYNRPMKSALATFALLLLAPLALSQAPANAPAPAPAAKAQRLALVIGNGGLQGRAARPIP